MFGKGRYLLLVLAMTTIGPYLLSTTAGLKNLGTWFRPQGADNGAVVAGDSSAAATADPAAAKPAAQAAAAIVHPMEDACGST